MTDTWCGPPLIGGEWRDLTVAESLEAVRLIAGCDLDLLGESDYELRRIRVISLACYPDSLLYEVQAWLPNLSRSGLMNLIHTPSGMLLLTGDNGPFGMLHSLRDTTTPERALQFAELFCSAVHGGEGRFQIIHSFEQFALHGQSLPEQLRQAIEPPAILRNPGNDGWVLDAIVSYGGFIFRSRFTMPDGQGLLMDDDTQIDEHTQIVCEEWHEQFRLPVTSGKGARP